MLPALRAASSLAEERYEDPHPDGGPRELLQPRRVSAFGLASPSLAVLTAAVRGAGGKGGHVHAA